MVDDGKDLWVCCRLLMFCFDIVGNQLLFSKVHRHSALSLSLSHSRPLWSNKKDSMFGIKSPARLFVLLNSFAAVHAFSVWPITQAPQSSIQHVARPPRSFAVLHATANTKLHGSSHYKNAISSELEKHQSTAAASSGYYSYWNVKKSFFMTFGLVATVAISALSFPVASMAGTSSGTDTGGASVGANAKITTGGASTSQSGRTIAITRGVNLDFSDFHGQNLNGVAFQQSIVRNANFRNANLVGASFFDATVDGSDFENAYVYIHYHVCDM
jgi:Pentapeptide repeats (8 copies)